MFQGFDHKNTPFIIAAGLILLIGAAGLYAWSQNGIAIYLTLVEQGLAWCF